MPYLNAYVIRIIVVACGLMFFILLLDFSARPRPKAKRKKKGRLAALPDEISRALAEARKATNACFAMCEALAITKALRVKDQVTASSRQLNDWNGPTDTALLSRTRTASVRALKHCRKLSVEGVEITVDASYVLLRGYLQMAEAACLNCKPVAGQKVCPALEFIEKISLT